MSSHSRSLRIVLQSDRSLFSQSSEHPATGEMLGPPLGLPRHCGQRRCTCQSPMPSRHLGIHTLNKWHRINTCLTRRQPFRILDSRRFLQVVGIPPIFTLDNHEVAPFSAIIHRVIARNRRSVCIGVRTVSFTLLATTAEKRRDRGEIIRMRLGENGFRGATFRATQGHRRTLLVCRSISSVHNGYISGGNSNL